MTKLTAIILTLLVNECFSQEKDLISINYGSSQVKFNDTTAGAKQFEAKMRVPLFHKKGNTIAGTVVYKNLHLKDLPSSFGHIFHAVNLQCVWLKKVDDNKTLAFFIQTGLFSDMKDISGKDIRSGAGFRYRVKHSTKLSTGWGLAYSKQFFGNQIIPFIDVDFRPNEKLSVTGQFPVRPRIMYHFNARAGIGFELLGDAASYRLNGKEYQHQYIQQNQWSAMARFEYSFAKSWQFNIGLGRNIKQTYKLYNDASTTPWTLITIPIGKRDEPVRKIESKGINLQAGLSFSPFD